MFGSQNLMEKWSPVLDADGTPEIQDKAKKAITAVVLENTEKALAEERGQTAFLSEANNNSTTSGAVADWDPILISLVRRAMPNIIAYDIAGVQPMTGPTGLIFAMKAKYKATVGADTEALGLDVPDTSFSGPHATTVAEEMGTSGGTAFAEMAFTIDKTTVTAQTRALKAEYTMELAQDLKAVHGLDAESELANILSTEILAEINREVLETVNSSANAANDIDISALPVTAGNDGRWAVERYKNLGMKIELEANAIAVATRRGKGSFILCSSNVASALAASGSLDYAPALSTNLKVDDTGSLFAGTLNGSIKVFVDPYAASDYVTVGYKGTNAYDAGLFYCPYVPLTMVKTIGADDFQPRIGFKTRYGMVSNPYTSIADNSNAYFRNFAVAGIQ